MTEYDSIRLTFLRGDMGAYLPAKSFAIVNSKIEKISDYDIGFKFFHSSIEVPADLATIARTISAYAAEGWFRINGAPTAAIMAQPSVPVRRLKLNFPPFDTKFWSFDLDKWRVPPELAAKNKWDLSNPYSTAKVIRALLESKGLHALAISDFVFLLTSSQFDRGHLNCHLYFLFEKEKGNAELRATALGINTGASHKVLDSAPYKSVQPDFIAPPNCTNFPDPIPSTARIFYSESESVFVLDEYWYENVKSISPTDWNSTSQLVEPLNKNWYDTVMQYVGSGGRGINEPAYRAAAQMVQELGRTLIVSNIHTYAQQLHDAAWEAITRHGVRGDAKDKATYVLATFRQYLESATRGEKEFGKEVDDNVKLVNSAIDAAIAGRVSSIVERGVLSAAATLASRFPSAWLPVKARIKKDLRGIITMGDLDKLMKKQSPGSEVATMLTGDMAANENVLVRPLLKLYDYFKDQDRNVFIGINSKEEGKDQKIVPFDSSLLNLFYRDGLERSTIISANFGKKCMAVIAADVEHPQPGGLSFTEALMGDRVVVTGDVLGDACWYNLGEQDNGVKSCIKIDKAGLTVFNHKDSEVKWVKDVMPNLLPTEESFKVRFGENADLTSRALIDYYQDNITKYISCEFDDVPYLTSWLVAAITCRPLAYIAEFIGPSGTGKSTGADLAKDLIDPINQSLSAGGSRSVFSGRIDSDFYALLSGQLVTIIDNIGMLKPQVQDVLCQVSTGLKFNERILYTQVQLEKQIQKPIILTSIDRVITRPDLATRAMSINFFSNPEYDPQFLNRWMEDKSFFFGALLHIVQQVGAMLNEPESIKSGMAPRDILIGAVSAVLSGSTIVDVGIVDDVRRNRAIDSMQGSNFNILFAAYFQSMGLEKISKTTTELYKDFNNWLDENIGTEVSVRLSTVHEELDRITMKVVRKDIPDTPRSFGWNLNKYRGSFDELSGWELTNINRMARGVVRVYRKRKFLTELF